MLEYLSKLTMDNQRKIENIKRLIPKIICDIKNYKESK